MGAAILLFLTSTIGGLIWMAFRIFGIGIITYQGLDLAVTEVEAFITTQIGGMPSNIISILGIARIDEAMQIILSSYTVAFTIKATGGLFKKIGFKP